MNRKIKNTLLLLGGLLLQHQAGFAQQLVEKTNLRLYEHHSSSKTNAAFGDGANGTQSAYNFIDHRYVSSFDMGNNTAYSLSSQVPASIDMVEHNGPYGNGGGFAFTSGESSIWQQSGPPYIRGNAQTLYYRAPSNFNYETITQESEIKNAFVESSARTSVSGLSEGSVYIAKLRNIDKYVAIKITNVKENTQASGNDDVYFDFRYKYAGSASGINEMESTNLVSLFPNPATSLLKISMAKPEKLVSARIYNLNGQLQQETVFNNNAETNIDVQNLPKGVYYIQIIAADNTFSNCRFVKM